MTKTAQKKMNERRNDECSKKMRKYLKENKVTEKKVMNKKNEWI